MWIAFSSSLFTLATVKGERQDENMISFPFGWHLCLFLFALILRRRADREGGTEGGGGGRGQHDEFLMLSVNQMSLCISFSVSAVSFQSRVGRERESGP